MTKLLLVEDDILLGQGVIDFLNQQGYQCDWVQTLAEVEEFWYSSDLVILDRQLPDGDSSTFLPNWLMKKSLPVIFLTARIDIKDRVDGLAAGARDYMIKPFSNHELLARIQTQLRPVGEVNLHYGDIVLNLATHDVFVADTHVELKPKEFQLLLLLVQNLNRVYHRDELLNQVWGYQSFPSTRTVDNHVLQLRQKLPDLDIETIRGVGYRLKG
ncbi:response regulator transcription factor [Candidatus Sororendozoicomonas aggregata]|uniref:response regulator transcription factor n=1 Tax=Candidatus Sororendozoicomonas aggregata TaxID=3073239 RepID=UPI002ED40789